MKKILIAIISTILLPSTALSAAPTCTNKTNAEDTKEAFQYWRHKSKTYSNAYDDYYKSKKSGMSFYSASDHQEFLDRIHADQMRHATSMAGGSPDDFNYELDKCENRLKKLGCTDIWDNLVCKGKN